MVKKNRTEKQTKVEPTKFKLSDIPSKHIVTFILFAFVFAGFRYIVTERPVIKGETASAITLSIVIYAISFCCFSFCAIFLLELFFKRKRS